MRHKNLIYFLVFLFFTLVGSWALPALVKKATINAGHDPFMYCSAILKKLCFVDFKDKEYPLRDKQGQAYPAVHYDSLMPLLNYRQLLSEGKLPDSLNGQELTPQLIRLKSVSYRYNPAQHFQTPVSELYLLYEAMPKRVGLKLPEDAFRMKEQIEFIDAGSNRVDREKSEIFQRELVKKGFAFPARQVWGNPNPRKPYDEGYFCLDDKGQLFHLKMVNGRPFVKNTGAGDSLQIAYFSMQEVADKRYYGYLFDSEGQVYLLEDGDGQYLLRRLEIDPLNLEQDKMTILGNLMFWTVTVRRPDRTDYYALETETLQRIDEYRLLREPVLWDKVKQWLFPWYLTFTTDNSSYIRPVLHVTAGTALLLPFVLAVATGIWMPANRKRKVFSSLYVLLTGLPGLLALLLLPDFKRKPIK